MCELSYAYIYTKKINNKCTLMKTFPLWIKIAYKIQITKANISYLEEQYCMGLFSN